MRATMSSFSNTPRIRNFIVFFLFSILHNLPSSYAFQFTNGWKLPSSNGNSVAVTTPRFGRYYYHRINNNNNQESSITALLGSLSSSARIDLKHRLTDSLNKQQQNKDDGQNKSVLPIFDVLESVREELNSKPNLLLQAAPGAGKTTIVPLQLLLDLLLLEEDEKNVGGKQQQQILVVAPRRVAVRSAAQRMAALIGERSPGGTVGYAMRDEVKVGSSTRIKVVTDGVLLNVLRDDPEMKGVGIVILDEFHERGVGSDTSLALLREVQLNFRANDLKILVMSATLLGNTNDNVDDNEESSSSTGSKLLKILGGSSNCGIVESEGRQYPIKLQWANEVVQTMSKNNNRGNSIPPLGSLLRDRKSLISTVANVVERAALQQAPNQGDILVFVPGAAECRGVVRELNSKNIVADVFALYGAMPKEDQDRVLYPSSHTSRQRVIVSTPIAEASLTIPGVTCVVDSGLRREPRCDADTGMSRLVSTRISRASAIQRMGRAGRVQEGSCLRLYMETDFQRDFLEQSPPEIVSTDLAPILLLLADAWGVSTLSEILHEMPFLDPPKKESLERAKQFLIDIGALAKTGDGSRFKLTKLGQKISKMPCHPRLATCVFKAMNQEDPTVLAASIAAAFCLDDDSSVQRNNNNDDPNLAYAIQSIPTFSSASLQRFAGRVGGTRGKVAIQALDDTNFMKMTIANLGKAMLPGFVDLVGERKGDASYNSSNYFLALGKSCRLSLRKSPEYILAVETNTGPDGISRIRSYVPLAKDLLEDIAVDRSVLYTVPSKGYQVRAKRVKSVGSIELSSTPLPISPTTQQEEVSGALLKAMNEDLGGIDNALMKFISPDDKSSVEDLIARIRLDKELTQNDDDVANNNDNNNWPLCFEALSLDNVVENGGLNSNTKKKEILNELIEPWIGSVQSLKELKTLDILRSTLSLEQQKYLDNFYPTSIDAPDGSRIPVQYNIRRNNGSNEKGRASYRPMATAKLQQFFGVQETPSIGRNKVVPLTLSLVSPARKPLAETSDLPFFWKEVYPSIRSEMRGKYRRHPWPEDPLVAVATSKTKRQLLYDTGELDKGESKRKRKKKKK